jgi:hypothetical protein
MVLLHNLWDESPPAISEVKWLRHTKIASLSASLRHTFYKNETGADAWV